MIDLPFGLAFIREYFLQERHKLSIRPGVFGGDMGKKSSGVFESRSMFVLSEGEGKNKLSKTLTIPLLQEWMGCYLAAYLGRIVVVGMASFCPNCNMTF